MFVYTINCNGAAMQETRRYILDILKEHNQATVDDIVDLLQTRRGKEITAVTVRHHLGVLQQEGLITEPELRHRSTPGRPQHVYMLTDKAQSVFPNNYQKLVSEILSQIQHQMPENGVNVILEGVADSLASQAYIPDLPLNERLDAVTHYLNEQGYEAYWEHSDDGYVLHTRNCPYHNLATTTEALCEMDMRLIATLVGSVPRRLSRISQGDPSCAYLIAEAG